MALTSPFDVQDPRKKTGTTQQTTGSTGPTRAPAPPSNPFTDFFGALTQGIGNVVQGLFGGNNLRSPFDVQRPPGVQGKAPEFSPFDETGSRRSAADGIRVIRQKDREGNFVTPGTTPQPPFGGAPFAAVPNRDNFLIPSTDFATHFGSDPLGGVTPLFGSLDETGVLNFSDPFSGAAMALPPESVAQIVVGSALGLDGRPIPGTQAFTIPGAAPGSIEERFNISQLPGDVIDQIGVNNGFFAPPQAERPMDPFTEFLGMLGSFLGGFPAAQNVAGAPNEPAPVAPPAVAGGTTSESPGFPEGGLDPNLLLQLLPLLMGVLGQNQRAPGS